LCQSVLRNVLVAAMAVTHLVFLKPSLVAVRGRSGKPDGSVIGSRAYRTARIVCGCSVLAAFDPHQCDAVVL
jgi:hypothetical protein